MIDLPKLFDLHNRVAVVTGGAGLLGSEFCLTLAQAGAQVMVADLDSDDAAIMSERLQQQGLSARSVGVNVTDPASVHNMVEEALAAFGRLDILVNSAALDPKMDPEHLAEQPARIPEEHNLTSFEHFPLEAWKQALDVNLTGMFLCCQSAIQPMLAQGQGVIINLSSIYGLAAPDQRLYARPGQSPHYKPAYYSVTKAGVLGLTRYLAAYYGEQNIRVNALSPGGVYNGHDDVFVQAYSARAVLGRMAEKDEMNGALLFLASDASTYMTGSNLVVDGGWTTW
jgi:NAD(P)-dependent dehydrogenase (short-subunit alcohol dehydrogenase family)